LEGWDAIHDRLHPLVDRTLACRTMTIAGLGMQARAASLGDDDLDEGYDETDRVRNLILSLCAFCGEAPIIRSDAPVS
jgi:hypothetical protein